MNRFWLHYVDYGRLPDLRLDCRYPTRWPLLVLRCWLLLLPVVADVVDLLNGITGYVDWFVYVVDWPFTLFWPDPCGLRLDASGYVVGVSVDLIDCGPRSAVTLAGGPTRSNPCPVYDLLRLIPTPFITTIHTVVRLHVTVTVG